MYTGFHAIGEIRNAKVLPNSPFFLNSQLFVSVNPYLFALPGTRTSWYDCCLYICEGSSNEILHFPHLHNPLPHHIS